jgi:DNA-binding beta-propeller fold protein YncE
VQTVYREFHMTFPAIRFLSVASVLSIAGCTSTPSAPSTPSTPSTSSLSQPYAVIAHWKIGGDARWDYLHIDSATQRLYVSHGNKVEILDANNGKSVGMIDGLQGVHGITIDGTGKFGYISDSAGGIVIFDTRTLAKVKTIPVPAGQGADGIVYEPLTKTVWTYNGSGGNASTTGVDTTTQQLVATIAVSPQIGKERLEAQTTDGKGHVFGNLGGVIARIDARTRQIDAQWQTGCESASGLAYDTAKDRIFQACRGQKMYVVDATSGKVLGTSQIGDRPDGAGYSAQFKLAFASTGDGFLTVVDANTPGYPTAQKLATQSGARTMDYDPKMDRVYTLAAEPDLSLPPQPSGNRQNKADTFGVIVIGRQGT